MNIHAKPNLKSATSVCPHDCPSTCALDVELKDDGTIGRVRGAKANTYTLGIICEKVARYAERIHHPDRLLYPLRRTGPKGSGRFARTTWDEAMDEIGQRFNAIETEHGAAAILPYFYAGTMGLVMRDGIERLRNVKKYSGMHDTFCIALSWSGYYAGTGRMTGVDSREMQKSDLIIVWGGNPVNTQVNVMTHVGIARKTRGAKLACIDIYETGTMQQADIKVILRPGTDGALACAIMHILFRNGYADRAFLAQYTDCPADLEAHLKSKTPEWASAITGVPVATIEELARAIGETKRTFFRLGYGFTRGRNGAANMHAVTCIPAVTGAWQNAGGGALHSNSGIFKLNKTMIEGLDAGGKLPRYIDQSRIGEALLGNPDDLAGGPPIKAMFIQNTNPVSVAPDQSRVKRGFAREDLFTVVHEQFMTETAAMADIVLPATMFLEHDDLYTGSGHTHLMLGPKLVDAPGECRSNHEVIVDIAARVGAKHQGFDMTPAEIVDWTLQKSKRGTLDELRKTGWLDVQPDFETAHFLNGFGHPDKKFHFRADWQATGGWQSPTGALGPVDQMPMLPDHWDVTSRTDATHPFRLATSPARTFLNSSFNETPSSVKREGRPSLLIHPDDLASLGASEGDLLIVSNERGEVILHAKPHKGQQRGVVIAEGLWPNAAHANGSGINTLTGADQPAPAGGGTYHDIAVGIRKA
jgi:anaerobic selenocysteine-containing dehydrogenase